MKILRRCVAAPIVLLNIQIATAQDKSPNNAFDFYGSASGFSASASYSSNSKSILTGNAFQRKITQISLGYEHKLIGNRFVRLSYEGSIIPVFLESDPTTEGTYVAYPNQPTTYTYFSPVRTLGTQGGPVPVGQVYYNNGFLPIYPVEGPRQTTYAFAALPLGTRINGLPRKRTQPTFAVNLGALYAARNVPIDYTSSFNFLAYAGPGVEVFFTRKRSLRLEYLYEHLSNADLGYTNPGIDSATFRLTLSRYR